MEENDDIIETVTSRAKTLTNRISIRFHNEKLSLIDLAKKYFLLTIPYLAIFFLFITYVLIGASIIHEIEYSPSFYKQASNNNLKELLNNFNKNLFNELDILKETQLDNQPDENDIKTLKFFTKLFIRVRNNDSKLTSDDIFHKIVKYFIRYKQNLINSINDNVQEILENGQNNFISQNLTSSLLKTNEYAPEWTFSQSLIYIISCLTTIGYKSITPQTIAGKLFTILYSSIGIPFTLIVLSNLSKLLAQFLKLLYALVINLYQKRLYSPINKTEMEKERFLEGIINCYEEIDDFPSSLLFILVFIYTTIGTLFTYSESLLDGYLNIFLTLTQTSFEFKEYEKPLFSALFLIYVLLGLALFGLIIKYLEKNVQILLTQSGNDIFLRLKMFRNQFGHHRESIIAVDSFIQTENDSILSEFTTDKHPPKKTSIIKDALFQASTKCDKQTQVTTLLSSQYRLMTSSTDSLNNIIYRSNEYIANGERWKTL